MGFGVSLRKAVSLVLFASLLFALNFSWGGRPALYPLLNPFNFVVGAMDRAHWLGWEQLPTLGPVKVATDSNGVPHVFAESWRDFFLVQGYLHAKDRLFQMDVQSRPGGARLSEMFGPQTLQMDKFFLRIGIREAANQALMQIDQDPETREAVTAYTQGVNTWIRHLPDRELPFEYRLLGVKPTPWTHLRTAEFLKIMTLRLNGRSKDLLLTQIEQQFGNGFANEWFPSFDPALDLPFVSHLKSMPLPKVFSSAFVSRLRDWPTWLQPLSGNGSNNWAVAAHRSEGSVAMLANDTHLAYSLPSVWYEIQAHVGGQNLYGASFAGVPGIVIGFTQKIGWGVTNGTSDAIDWFEMEFKDSRSQEYLFDDQWLRLNSSTEDVVIKGAASQRFQLHQTVHGPLVHRESNLGLSVSWTALQPSNELKTFLQLNKALDHQGCRNALIHYKTPAQNFICADAANISIQHVGAFPERAFGQGRTVLDGRSSANQWRKWIDHQQMPSVVNPPEGFVFSANQPPADLSKFPYFLGWDYEESFRARRIYQELSQDKIFSLTDMVKLQNDVVDLFAQQTWQLVEPVLRAKLRELLDSTSLELVSSWRGEMYDNLFVPSLFWTWWPIFEEEIYGKKLGGKADHLYPRSAVTLREIARVFGNDQSGSAIGDASRQPNPARGHGFSMLGSKDNAVKLISHTFQIAWNELEKNHGPFSVEAWSLGRVFPTEIPHIGKIPGLGAGPWARSGSRYSVNASRGDHGPVWKMVVQWSEPLKAFTSTPGGTSGNPFAKDYTRDVEAWRNGEMKPVHFWLDESQITSQLNVHSREKGVLLQQ